MSYIEEEASLLMKDEEEEEEEIIEGPDHAIFLIDTAASMFNHAKVKFNEADRSSFGVAVQVAIDCMERKARSGGNDEFAVVLYNTAKSNDRAREENVFVWVERDVPSVDDIQSLVKLTDERFHAEIGTFTNFSEVPPVENLSKALTACADIFQSGRRNIGSSKYIQPKPRIFLFTNEEFPGGFEQPDYRDQLMARIKTLQDMNTSLAVIPLIQALGQVFDYSRFWAEIQQQLPDEEGVDLVQGSNEHGDLDKRIEALFINLQKRLEKRRSLGTLLMNIPGGLTLGLQMFKLTSGSSPVKAIRLNAQTNEQVELKQRHVLSTTGTHIAPSLKEQREMRKQYRKVFAFSDKKHSDRDLKVMFTMDEYNDLKAIFDQGLELLGFKPISHLQDYHNLGTATFLRPAEKRVAGSVTAFKALLDAMLAQGKIGVCRFARLAKHGPKLVALLPQAEATDEFGYQVAPAGMHLIPMPYADDLRVPERLQQPRATQEQVCHAFPVMENMPYDFELGMIEDPSVEHHFNTLEAIFLGKEPPSVEDSRREDMTIEPKEKLDTNAGQEIEEFKNQVLGADYHPGATAKGSSKHKYDDAFWATQYARIPWNDLIREGERSLMKQTADTLRVYLAYHRLPVYLEYHSVKPKGGTKSQQVEKILKHASKDK